MPIASTIPGTTKGAMQMKPSTAAPGKSLRLVM